MVSAGMLLMMDCVFTSDVRVCMRGEYKSHYIRGLGLTGSTGRFVLLFHGDVRNERKSRFFLRAEPGNGKTCNKPGNTFAAVSPSERIVDTSNRQVVIEHTHPSMTHSIWSPVLGLLSIHTLSHDHIDKQLYPKRQT